MELNKLYNMDCMEGMKAFPDKFFDLAVVDPPYGIGEDGGTNKTRGKLAKAKTFEAKGWDKDAPPVEYFEELIRVSKHQIIFGANHFIDRIPFGSPCWIVWDKDNGKTDFADCELAYTSFTSSVRKFKFKWQGMLQGDMKNKEIRIHPTQKPVKLYEWILRNYADPSFKILDTHGGSCSSVCAMIDFGCDWIAFEKDEEYYLKAKERIENHVKQGNLFRPEKPSYTQTKIA